MKVTFDENGYVNGWCMVGDNGGEEYDPPEDFDSFLDNCFCFKQPAQEAKCLAEGKTDISEPISETMAIAVIGFADKPGIVKRRFSESL